MRRTSPEFNLLAASCRWPPSPERIAAVKAAASADLDWHAFERAANRHRVAALAHDGLRRADVIMPPDVAMRLSEESAVAGRAGLAMTRETMRVQAAFATAGLECLFLKGVTLGMLAYGGLGVKRSWDIDLLTTPEDAPAAARLLTELGYEPEFPGEIDDKAFGRLVALEKECLLINRRLAIAVDLHWRLVDNRRLLEGVQPSWPRQVVPLGPVETPTLAPLPLFAYLCVHGGQHGWSRLKWLADVAALLGQHDAVGIERLHVEAVALGAGRAPGLAILLCERLFGIAVPPGLSRRLRADHALRGLEALALACLLADQTPADLPVWSLLRLRLMLSHFRLGTGAPYVLAEAAWKLASYEDRLNLPLPGPLHFLYVPLRIPLWMLRRLRRTGAPAA